MLWPTRVQRDQTFIRVSVGTMTCATRLDGTTWCWGREPGDLIADGQPGQVYRTPVQLLQQP